MPEGIAGRKAANGAPDAARESGISSTTKPRKTTMNTRKANCTVVKYTDQNDEVARIACIIEHVGASGVGLRSCNGEWTNEELAILEWPEPYGLDRDCTLVIDFSAKKYRGNLMLFVNKEGR